MKIKHCSILIGIPTSGKTTYALKQRQIILSRDNLRESYFGKKYKQNNNSEKIITDKFWEHFNKICRSEQNFIIDNTNCNEKYLNEYCHALDTYGYSYSFKYFDISLKKAFYRNIIRWIKTGKYIPFNVIKNMKKRFDKLKRY